MTAHFLSKKTEEINVWKYLNGISLPVLYQVGLIITIPCCPVQYLNNCVVNCCGIFYSHSWSPEDESYWLELSPYVLPLDIIVTFVVLIEMSQQLLKIFAIHFGPHIHDPHRMDSYNSGDPLTSPMQPSPSYVCFSTMKNCLSNGAVYSLCWTWKVWNDWFYWCFSSSVNNCYFNINTI